MNIRTFFVVLFVVSSVAMTNNVYAMQNEDDERTREESEQVVQLNNWKTKLEKLKNKLQLCCQTPETKALIKKITITLLIIAVATGVGCLIYFKYNAICALCANIAECCRNYYEIWFDPNGVCPNLDFDPMSSLKRLLE